VGAGKVWGDALVRTRPALVIVIGTMSDGHRTMRLSVEIGSDPVAGELAIEAGPAQRFSGWVELVERIEAARCGCDWDDVAGVGATGAARV
jgi:hypothetical protein